MRELPPFLTDVQTGVVRGFDVPVVAYLFFRITNRQEFVDALPSRDGIAPGLGIQPTKFYTEEYRIRAPAEEEPAVAFRGFAHIAFTYTGLKVLGVHARTLASFPEPFREGMAARAALLGDEGEAAPERWDGYLGSREVHGVTWGSFDFVKPQPTPVTEARLASLMAKIASVDPEAWLPPIPPPPRLGRAHAAALRPKVDARRIPGAEVLHVEYGMANYIDGSNGERYRIEHFGFRDGISQPYADIGLAPPAPGGGTPRPDDSWAPVAIGEVLLGYADEDGLVQHLPANRCLRNNGSYMVFRKLEQDVVGFRNFLRRNDRSGNEGRLGAQLIGRWPDGTAVVRYPNGPEADPRFPDNSGSPPPARTINDFRYQRDDPLGRRCPIGAHIRRVNPRDTNHRDEARHHRLFRRSMSYGGAPLPDGSPGDGFKRGLLFIAMQARLDRQFEFAQTTWLNRGEFAGQAGARRDPVTGAHAGGLGDAFQPAGAPAPITHLPRFVTLRGGDYFFVPSFTALGQFKANSNFPPDDPEAPMPEDALGHILPAQTDNTPALIALGKRLLAEGAPSVWPLPPVIFRPFPGGPPQEINTVVVGRYAYVKGVLCDEEHFSTEIFDRRSQRILGGERLLIGMGATEPERLKRLDVLHKALALLGPLPVAQITDRLTRGAFDRVQPLGRLDVVGDLGRVIPILATGVLFGVPGPAFVSPTGIATLFGRLDVTDMPDDWLRTLQPVDDYAKPLATMQTWTRLSFLEIFVNGVDAEEIAAAAERAVREFIRQITSLIQQARQTAHPGKPRNLLEALIRVPLDPEDGPDPERHMRLILAEFTAGAIETINAALANLVDYLLDHRDYLKKVISEHLGLPSRNGSPDLDVLISRLDDPDLDILINEILRFDPMGPLSFRTCAKDTTIGDADVTAGTIICLVPAAAMIDDRVFPESDTIRFDRPPENYLHFGAGTHRCAGQTIVDPIVFPIALPMLRVLFRNIATLPRLRRAAGAGGNKVHTFPILADSLIVRFTPPDPR